MTLARWLRTAFARRSAPITPPARRLGVEWLEARDNPSGGLLDPTFGTGGQLASSFSGFRDQANAVAAQPDGKVVVVGSSLASGSRSYDAVLVARYNADSSLDASFGSGGHTTTALSSSNNSWASRLALLPQADGTDKILVAGAVQTSTSAEVALVRYNANGTLDTTFGSKGKVVTDLGSGVGVGSVALDGSGRIVVSSGNVLARFTAGGALDGSFGTKGKVTVQHGGGIALQPDGKIVVLGGMSDPAGGTEFVTVRYTANGALDTTFGTDGSVATHVGTNDSGGGLAIDSSGRILVAGWDTGPTAYNHHFDLLRYTPDGSPDGTFGVGGLATPTYPETTAGHPALWIASGQSVAGVAVQADGEIVVGGLMTDGQSGHVVATRVDTNGNLDTSYGTGGWAAGPSDAVGTPNGRATAVALQPDGRLLIAGYAPTNTTASAPWEVSLTRFLGSTSPAVQIGSFAAAPNPVAAGGTETLTADNITDTNTGAMVTQVAFYAVDSNGTEVFLGYGTENPDGTWTLPFVVNLAPGSYTFLALAADSSGAVGDPAALSLDVA